MAGKVCLAFALLLAASTPLMGQMEDREYIDEEFRREMDEAEASRDEYRQDLLWDAGGWLFLQYVTFQDEPVKNDRTLRLADLRLWGDVTLYDEIHIYARIRNVGTDWNSGDAYEGPDNDIDAPRIDQAYAETTFRDLLGAEGNVRIRGGRQYAFLGRGAVFNKVADGGQLEWRSDVWSGKLLALHSNQAEDDFDADHPDEQHMRRLFLGGELAWEGIDSQRLYAYGLRQVDRMDEDPEIVGQDFLYDSWYVGLGARGVITSDVTYHIEGILEGGESMPAVSVEEEDIDAWAFTLSLYYQPEWPMSPVFSAEYYAGSGDSDRGSITDTISGNAAGTDDEGFLGFGYLMTGYSLFPKLSNIHIYKVGVTTLPLENEALFRTLSVGTALYFYRKDKTDGVISDGRGNDPDKDIGHEWDLFVRWRPLSDVGVSANYGLFVPGDAYPDGSDEYRSYFSLGVTYGF